MSKGSARRPQRVSREEYERRWAETFGVKGLVTKIDRRRKVVTVDWLGPDDPRRYERVSRLILEGARKEFDRTWLLDEDGTMWESHA